MAGEDDDLREEDDAELFPEPRRRGGGNFVLSSIKLLGGAFSPRTNVNLDLGKPSFNLKIVFAICF